MESPVWNAHRVEVLHVANGDGGVVAVAHHFVFDFFPADEDNALGESGG
jgi:hypothetical protein